MGAYDNLIIVTSFIIGIMGFSVGIHYTLKTYYENTSLAKINVASIDEFKDL